MRGKVRDVVCARVLGRITPAYAGKSFLSAISSENCWDHPRLCGEKANDFSVLIICIGSPPPMRGKDKEWAKQGLLTRITPAYAGKRFRFECSQCRFWDHPRLCGEKSFVPSSFFALSGSPPPMRGKVYDAIDTMRLMRITPAYAGKRVYHDNVAYGT